MKVKEILIQYLKDNGFDGLFLSELECGVTNICCSSVIDDLIPCASDPTQCKAGKLVKCSGCEDFSFCVADENFVCEKEG